MSIFVLVNSSMVRVILYSIVFALFKIATIGGGTNNVINPSTGDNAILGGSFNNDSGFSGVMIAGNGITAVRPNTLHINGLWANGIPGPGGVLVVVLLGRILLFLEAVRTAIMDIRALVFLVMELQPMVQICSS